MRGPQTRQPPYHLRPNKAVDRFVFIEAIKKLDKLWPLTEYTYYGFGGPHLEEFRILYEFWPDIKMVSIEEQEEVYKRQKFHLPCRRLKLVMNRFSSFLAQYDPKDKKSIFWLDNTTLEYRTFENLELLLGKVADFSVIKVTLKSEPSDYDSANPAEKEKKANIFNREFGAVLPTSSTVPPPTLEGFAILLQEMVQIASQRALQHLCRAYQPLSSFCYADGAGMFTFTGIVCPCEEQGSIRDLFQPWEFANVDWSEPRKIELPTLSTKERLHLQRRLPCRINAGRVLRKALGYLIDDSEEKSEEMLKQYADFHRYFPYFLKAIP